MKRTKAELMERAKAIIGDNTSDEAIALLEDISDSFDTETDTTDWKAKYEENDKMWRDKYTSRFFDGSPDDAVDKKKEQEDEQAKEDDAEDITIDDLFE